MQVRNGYTATQIRLHWIVFLAFVFQLIFGESMGESFRPMAQTGAAPVYTTMIWAHIGVGVLILVLALWRLALRLTRGVPADAAGTPALQAQAGHVIHWTFYALMVALPVSGLMAWYGGFYDLGELHGEVLKALAIVLILLHVAAALYHQFIVKDNLLDRMRTPRD